VELTVEHTLPVSLADLPATALADELGGPTLFDLRKPNQPPLFVSVLLHGNEISGWDAVRALFREVTDASTLLFLGNLEAAAHGMRALPGGADFNRVWETRPLRGRPENSPREFSRRDIDRQAARDRFAPAEEDGSAEAAVAAEVTTYVQAAKPRFALDIHNTTGDNPPYSVVSRSDPETLAFAGTFSTRALLATQPHGFQTRRFARFCTAMTIEVGTPDDPSSTTRAAAFLATLLASGAHPPNRGRLPESLDLYETVARVTLADGAVLDPDVQRFNFRTAPAGTALTRSGGLRATDADEKDLGGEYFGTNNGLAVLKRPTMLAMYTGEQEAARRDCLCYFLEPVA